MARKVKKPEFIEPYKYDRETKAAHAGRTEFLRNLWEALEPGDTITTVLRHVSSSGMSRSIDAYLLTCENGKIIKEWLSYRIAHAGIGTYDPRREAVKMGGAGMDMGFALVYALSSMLYPKGFACIDPADYEAKVQKWLHGDGKRPEQRCQASDHSNGLKARGPKVWHANGGYALRQSWLS